MEYVAYGVLALVIVGLVIALVRKSPTAVARFEAAASSVEPKLEDTMHDLLLKAELHLTNTDDEDADIAKATKSKARKRLMLEQHVAKLQAHLTGPAA